MKTVKKQHLVQAALVLLFAFISGLIVDGWLLLPSQVSAAENSPGSQSSRPDAQTQFQALKKLGVKFETTGDGTLVAADLSKSKVSDHDMQQIAALSGLKILKLPPRITDAGLAQVKFLSNLEKLYLYETQITDAGLEHLQQLRRLKELHFNNTQIGDDGLKHLKALTQLKVLNLTSTKVTRDGLKELNNLKRLEKLSIRGTSISLSAVVRLFTVGQKRDLVAALDALDAVERNKNHEPIAIDVGGTKFSDAELAYLTEIPTLKELHLSNTEITDAGMVHLRKLPKLEGLYLAKCNIGDAGLAHIKGLVQLRVLNLYGTKTTSAGLEHLLGLKKLKALYITDLKLSTASVDKLRKELPNLSITDFTAQ